VIISMPMVRLAPGVWSICWRVMRVVGVTESDAATEDSSPSTTTVCDADWMASGMWSRGLVPLATVMDCSEVAKPLAATLSV
jgi:hypothetical protein